MGLDGERGARAWGRGERPIFPTSLRSPDFNQFPKIFIFINYFYYICKLLLSYIYKLLLVLTKCHAPN